MQPNLKVVETHQFEVATTTELSVMVVMVLVVLSVVGCCDHGWRIRDSEISTDS